MVGCESTLALSLSTCCCCCSCCCNGCWSSSWQHSSCSTSCCCCCRSGGGGSCQSCCCGCCHPLPAPAVAEASAAVLPAAQRLPAGMQLPGQETGLQTTEQQYTSTGGIAFTMPLLGDRRLTGGQMQAWVIFSCVAAIQQGSNTTIQLCCTHG